MRTPKEQIAELAFREVPGPPLADRRRSQRIRQPLHAEICEWNNNRAGAAFSVVINDLSTAGVGILHNDRLKVGSKYLLEIPRPGQPALSGLLNVVRCSEFAGGLVHVQLEPQDVLDITVRASMRAARPEKSSRALMAYVMVAIVGAALLVLRYTL